MRRKINASRKSVNSEKRHRPQIEKYSRGDIEIKILFPIPELATFYKMNSQILDNFNQMKIMRIVLLYNHLFLLFSFQRRYNR